MLATSIFDCGVYSHQVTFLEILFRFFSDYRTNQFEDQQQNSPDLVSQELFPANKNKDELIEIFLNINKISYDIDSRKFLNKLNRSVKPCKIFSIVAESVTVNENELIAPILSNRSYQFWIDFNLSICQISFSCKGEGSENGWVANCIAKEDLEKLLVVRNATHLNLSVYKNNNLNLGSSMVISESNLSKIDFRFLLNDEPIYLVDHVLPTYNSFLNSNNTGINELTPTKEQCRKPKHCQKVITPKTIERLNKYDTIVEEQEAEEQQVRAEIINYANTNNSFTFEQSFSKSASFNLNILNELPIFQNQATQIESAKAAPKRSVLSNITNKIVNETPMKVVKSVQKRKRQTAINITKRNNTVQKKPSIPDNSDFDNLKSNKKSTASAKRKLYTKQVTEERIQGSQSSKENKNTKQRKRPKSGDMKLVNRVIPLQTISTKKRSDLLRPDYTNSEVLQIQANIEIINTGIQSNEETITNVDTENDIIPVVNSNLPLNNSVQQIVDDASSIYDIRNSRRVDIRDEEFVANVISQVRSQNLSQTVGQNQNNNKFKIPIVNPSLPLNGSIQAIGNRALPINNIRNSRRDVIGDEELASNVSRRDETQQAPSQNVQQKQNITKTKNNFVGVQTSAPLAKTNRTINDNKNISHSYRRYARNKNTSTKLGYNSNIDCIETYIEDNVGKSKQPLRVQGFRQSKSKIKNFCEINSSLEENENIVEPAQAEHVVVVAEVHTSDHNYRSMDANLSRLSNVASNESPIPTNVIGNEPNIAKHIERQCENTNLIISSKSTLKPIEQRNPIIPIPMPILTEEIKKEYIISVEDDSEYENWKPASPVNSEHTKHYSLKTRRDSVNIERTTERSSKRNISEAENETETNSEDDERPKRKLPKRRTLVVNSPNEIIQNNVISNLKQKNVQSRMLDGGGNRKLSHPRALITYSDAGDVNRAVGRVKGPKMRHTISIDRNIYQNRKRHDQLQELLDIFYRAIDDEVHVNELHEELQNIQNIRLEKEKYLSLIVDGKKQNLCNMQTKIVNLLESIKEMENELKQLYTNLFKTIEKITKR